ncbi:MAG: hypothetical protein Q7S66_00210 [bacterium]|nr:hypothetical protein [bacterium]
MLPTNGKPAASWQDAIKYLGKCPACSTEFKGDAAKVFAKKGGANLVHVNCDQCQNALMLMVVVMGHGLSSVSVVTDLTYDDAKRLYGSEEITLDEALEAWEFIQADKLKII